MFDPKPCGIRETVDFVRLSPAEKIRCDDVKIAGQRFDVRTPGDLLATVQQHEIRPAAGIEKMGLNITDYNCSMLV